ncbi:MAG: D-alanyl-D-alanine carboxypeptidase family protein [Cyanobacteria bacterium J06642_11]
MSELVTPFSQSMANFTDDIPEARRETLMATAEPTVKSASSVPSIAPWLLLAMAILGMAGAGVWWSKSNRAPAVVVEPTPATTGSAVAAETGTESATETAVEPAPAELATAATDVEPVSLLGHRAYDVADPGNMVEIASNPMVKLQPEVAQTVETMMAQAQAAGVGLGVISGFRSLEDQQYLFFDLKAERGQTAQTRAEVSAPPGYSEHHTGYAVDFVDLDQPSTDLIAAFEQTQAFRWLEDNAPYYGFEMSFPKGNDQNVAYEPWHWRYVGNQESLELFYQDND